MVRTAEVQAYVRILASVESTLTVFNPYRDTGPLDVLPSAPEDRCADLVNYLNATAIDLIVIGEHGGFYDALATGVPFASEYMVTAGVVPRVTKRLPVVPSRSGPPHDSNFGEIWQELNKRGLLARTLGWNIQPLVPRHAPRDDDQKEVKVRVPTVAELTESAAWARMLLCWHPNAEVIVMGTRSEKAIRPLLHDMGRKAYFIRQPSHRSIAHFRRELTEILDEVVADRAPYEEARREFVAAALESREESDVFAA